MNDQSPDTRGPAGEPRFARPPRGRHAIPRASALTRLRLPVGKALALTALPTALVFGSQRLPQVADTGATAALSAPEERPGGQTSRVDCARPDDTPTPAKPAPTSPTPSANLSTSSAQPSGEPAKRPEHTADAGTARTPAPTTAHSPAPSAASSASLADLLDPLLHDSTYQQTASPQVSPSPSPDTPTPKATAPFDPWPPRPHASPAPSHRSAETSPQPESAQGTARTCDLSDLKAPEDKRAGRFSAEPWNMKGSRLELHDLVFHGVVTVDTAAGPKRVLKFSATAVTIRKLRMAVPVGPQIQHIDGAPGSTSTLQGDNITMYVERLTGTLSGVENIPTPPVLRLNLTPDTVPEWLYDTIGKLELKLQLSLSDADIDQAGQTGGKLTIPGIHGYGTPR